MSSPRGPRTRSRILYHKENNPAEAQAGMRQHTVARTKRQPLASTPPPPEEPMVFAGREDVVALLSENMKGKNKEMQEYIKKLRACVKWLLEREDAILAETEKTHGLLDKLVAGNAKLENSVENTESQNEEIQKQHQSLQQRLEMLEAEKTDALRALKDEKEARAAMEKRLYDQNDLLNEVKGLRMYLQHSREDRDTNSAQETDSSQREIIKTLEIKLADADEKLKLSLSRLEEAKQQIVDGEKQRKKLHETILELKGKIRVFCRVRPLQSNEPGVVSYPKIGENFGRGIELMHNAQVYSFTFDKVFDDRASQQNVFIEVSELIQSALDGCKVSIFAYGQTGSGKTYTMMGDPTSDDKKGLIPRSLEQIFQASQTLNTQGWKYKIQVSVLEIYKKDIKDLLVTDRQDGVSRYEIYHDDNGNTVVSDLTIVDVTCTNEVSSLLRLANRSRSVGQTKMNEESSRSHLVFTVRIFGGNEGTGQQVQGIVNLIDLAGCERLEKSGATDDRLKETMAINKSLSCLSEVMLQISKKEEHVSFRNSTLTYLLQPCLSGSGKTLMLVNLSPEVSSSGETICSLRFAARVKSCEINAPHPQTQLHNPGSKAAAPSFAKCTAPPSPALRALLPLGANLSFPPPTPPPPLTHGPHQWKSPPFAPRTLPGHSGEQRWSRKNENIQSQRSDASVMIPQHNHKLGVHALNSRQPGQAKDSGKVGNHKEQRLEFQEV